MMKKTMKKMLTAGLVTAMVLGSVGVSETVVSRAESGLRDISYIVKTEQSEYKIKVAVLDSGVDYGNDINLAYSVSLVPGEEEMNPLFMDGTGHNKESNEYAGKDRYKAAKEATDLALNVYRDTSYVSGTYNSHNQKISVE